MYQEMEGGVSGWKGVLVPVRELRVWREAGPNGPCQGAKPAVEVTGVVEEAGLEEVVEVVSGCLTSSDMLREERDGEVDEDRGTMEHERNCNNEGQ